MKNNAQKGFTLIELMVVMAIIAVLATTLIPQLTGAQARARDAGRVATLKNFSAVLETYLSDEGVYPRSPSTATITATGNGCFSTASWDVNSRLADLLKWGKAQLNPQSGSVSNPCSLGWVYGYASLQKDAINDAGYVLTADLETWNKANAIYTELGTITYAGAYPYANISGRSTQKLTGETSPATNSIFVETN